MAHHLAEVFDYELVKDLWRLSTAQFAAVEQALKLKPGSADKLKEAVKAAQVFSLLLASCDSFSGSSLMSLRTNARRRRRCPRQRCPCCCLVRLLSTINTFTSFHFSYLKRQGGGGGGGGGGLSESRSREEAPQVLF